jgi:hypothetical protein
MPDNQESGACFCVPHALAQAPADSWALGRQNQVFDLALLTLPIGFWRSVYCNRMDRWPKPLPHASNELKVDLRDVPIRSQIEVYSMAPTVADQRALLARQDNLNRIKFGFTT